MISIDDVLISDAIVKDNFVCNLNSCKGACCWEGDFGAPLRESEAKEIEENIEKIKPYLGEKSVTLLNEMSGVEFHEEAEQLVTRCHNDGACVFLTKNELGIAMCGIEIAHKQAAVNFNKPISCHMYPIRVTKDINLDFEFWNYEEWDICNAACANGDKLQVPIYVFLKEAIIRDKGKEFYQQLDESAAIL